MEIMKILGNIVISPFGRVKFRDFFLADIITSASIILIDSSKMVCFYSNSNNFEINEPISCSWQSNINYFWLLLPQWWRFAQCLRRFYND